MLNPLQGKRRKNYSKKRNIEQTSAYQSEDGRTYGIDCLNLGEAVNNLEKESKWLLV